MTEMKTMVDYINKQNSLETLSGRLVVAEEKMKRFQDEVEETSRKKQKM